ncbi:MAG: bacterioferritin [Geminicoccaceae bacterium]
MSIEGTPEVLALLNDALRNELTAVHQFLGHAELLEDWGLTKMSAHEREEAEEEKAHASLIAQRILLLGGQPDYSQVGPVALGADVRAVLENDLALEKRARATLVDGIRTAEGVHDYVSRKLFAQILADEEAHENHLRIELELIGRIGLPNYIQAQM